MIWFDFFQILARFGQQQEGKQRKGEGQGLNVGSKSFAHFHNRARDFARFIKEFEVKEGLGFEVKT